MINRSLKPYVICHCRVKGQVLTHYIKTKVETGFYLDNAGMLVSWQGITWQILFSVKDKHLHKTGFIKLLPDGQIQFYSLTSEMLAAAKAAKKRKELEIIEQTANQVNVNGLKRIILRTAE